MASLFEEIGGEQAVMAAVALFYQKVLADEFTRSFFEGLDMEQQLKKQVAFMTWALEGPNEYKGGGLRTAHAHLVRDHGLNDGHFDAVVRHLGDALRELEVAEELIARAIAIVEGTRGEILAR